MVYPGTDVTNVHTKAGWTAGHWTRIYLTRPQLTKDDICKKKCLLFFPLLSWLNQRSKIKGTIQDTRHHDSQLVVEIPYWNDTAMIPLLILCTYYIGFSELKYSILIKVVFS